MHLGVAASHKLPLTSWQATTSQAKAFALLLQPTIQLLVPPKPLFIIIKMLLPEGPVFAAWIQCVIVGALEHGGQDDEFQQEGHVGQGRWGNQRE